VPLIQPDHLAQKLLVDLPQYLRRQNGEGIGALREVELLDDFLERAVIDLQAGGDDVRVFSFGLLMEMEYPRVVALIRLLEQLKKPGIDPLPPQEVLEPHISLNAPVLADAKEHYPVDDGLHRVVQAGRVQLRIAQGDVLGQGLPPPGYVAQQSGIHPLLASLLGQGSGIPVQRAAEHRLPGEESGYLLPLFCVLIISQIHYPRLGRLVLPVRPGEAVVN